MSRAFLALLLVGCLPDSDCPPPGERDADADGWPAEEDCDDDDASVYPGAPEACDDGVDQDCDGSDAPCRLAGDVALDAADAELAVPLAAGNADGQPGADLLVGRAGGADLFTWSGGPATHQITSSGRTGERVAVVGDVTGNGAVDVVLAERHLYVSEPGHTAILHLVTGPIDRDLVAPNDSLELLGLADDSAGEALGGPVDFDGDGQADLLLGAPHLTDVSHPGAAYILAGPIDADRTLDAPTWTLLGETPGDAAGRDVATPGDVDGDGIDDVLVASGPQGTADHAAWLVLGGVAEGVVELADAEGQYRPGIGDFFESAAVAGAGDVDGDGHPDILVGSFGASSYEGRAWLLPGGAVPPSSLEDAMAELQGGTGYHLGTSVDGAGDVDGDGLGDVLVGAPTDGPGRAWLLHGPVEGAITLAFDDPDLVRWQGSDDGDRIGQHVLGAGDVDGDGASDVVVSDPDTSWLFLGGVAP